MIPDFSCRISGLIKSLEHTIIPAIGADEGMAKEQAALIIGHLQMLDQQWNYAYLFEKHSLLNMRALAGTLLQYADREPALAESSRALKAIFRNSSAALPEDPASVNKLTSSLGNAVDDLIRHIYTTATAEIKQQVINTVLDYSAKQSASERVWFRANNLDPDVSDLVSIEEMIHTGIYHFRPGDLSP